MCRNRKHKQKKRVSRYRPLSDTNEKAQEEFQKRNGKNKKERNVNCRTENIILELKEFTGPA